MEDRTEAVEKSLKAAQKEKKKQAEAAYLSPELSEKAREEGNELFKQGKYPEAIEKYSDAMKRNPKSAASYQKLMEWQLALKDAETCVAMDPTFVKGWSRKGGIHLFLKEFHKALDCYQVILDLDPENADAKANMEHVMMKINEANQSGEADPERQKRAMADPEIQQILGDPKKANAAMQDPDISAKLQKLIAAGVLQVR